MEAGRRRGTGTSKNVVVAGSVLESRMKSDEVKGGIKVLNADEKPDENGEKKLRPKQSSIGVNGKRKTWKSESSDGGDRNPTQISRQRSEPTKELRNSGDGINVKSPIQKIKKTRSEVGRELSVSVDGIEKSPIRKMRTRSEVGRELSMSVDGIERSPIQKSQSQKSIRQSDTESSNADEIERNPIQKMKSRSEEIMELSLSVPGSERNPVQIRTTKSEFLKLIGQSDAESGNAEGIERNSRQLRKVKSESNKGVGGESGNVDGIEGNSVQLRKVKSESKNGLGESVDATEKSLIPSTQAKSVPSKVLDDGIERKPVELEAKSEPNEAIDESVEEIDKNPVGIDEVGSDEFCKEFGVCEEKVISTSLSNLGQVKSAPEMVLDDDEEEEDYDDDDDDEDWDEEFEEVDEEIEIDEVKEIEIKKPKQIVIEEKKVQKIQEKILPISPIVKKQVPPLVNHSRIHPIPTKTTPIPVPNGVQRPPETQTRSQRVPETHNKLQSLVDLVMWRDVSKSAFVFGLGTFIIISFSYTKDLNISFITVVSYLGLIYLAAIFLFRSIICRGVINEDDTRRGYLVGEEDATWLLKMVLPYLNEFLLKLRALFSGDPATTMKLAVLLFVLARSGSSITIWKMAKLGFFGVFTLPKICSSYSSQLTNYGKFWVRRFKDAWESCSHKKAVAFGIFTLVWNLSSVVARVWAVFMLYVAFRYYQQSMVTDNWVEEEPKCETTWQDPIGEHRRGRRTATMDARKNKKKF